MNHLKSLVRVFSVLGFAALALAVASSAQAQRTRTGGASGTGSIYTLHIKLFNEDAYSDPAVNGYFNVHSETTTDDFIQCEYTATDSWDDAQPMLCKMKLDCFEFQVERLT